ncbi:MAG TPA: hypothetical protein RMF84_02425 [Polyangiaceae bacterium LLY-WYZ-14_1]|nr:hypothetical protein [Polyangiaceae bacterium LLY-WYZ-14_1]
MRLALRLVLVLALVGGVAFTADALVQTDEERVATLVDGLQGTVTDRRLDRALRWVDLARQPVALVGPDGVEWFEDAEDGGALRERIRDAVGPYLGARARMIQRSVRVGGDDATLAVRVSIDGELADVQVRLRRQPDDDRWLVRRIRVL